ncbi:MAG TPA: hypothetical protein VGY58_23685 [Gemmataceae bacterium]|jgi:hypothetical protein|nr:hypothetical protein [Gemmataceae bacterium]
MSESEPRNPFYLLLLIASFVFVATALAYAVIPVMEERAAAAGQPPSAFRDALRNNGWKWLLYELAVMTGFAVLSMGLDRVRSLKKARSQRTIPPSQAGPTS